MRQEPLQGIKREIVRRRGKKVEQTVQRYDPAIILAIFSGPLCYVVVTNHRPQDGRSFWQNPFLAGKPRSITYFLTASDLLRWLTEVGEWPAEIAQRLAIEYESGRELLNHYEKRRNF